MPSRHAEVFLFLDGIGRVRDESAALDSLDVEHLVVERAEDVARLSWNRPGSRDCQLHRRSWRRWLRWRLGLGLRIWFRLGIRLGLPAGRRRCPACRWLLRPRLESFRLRREFESALPPRTAGELQPNQQQTRDPNDLHTFHAGKTAYESRERKQNAILPAFPSD